LKSWRVTLLENAILDLESEKRESHSEGALSKHAFSFLRGVSVAAWRDADGPGEAGFRHDESESKG
jgi:hypothetical protein